ncbi:hypothetical protein ACXYWE_00215 [Mesomycoplasma ovipneumoniae]
MPAQSELAKIIINNLLPSSIKAEMNKKDRYNMKEKLNSPIDFYSNNRWVMKNLAEKTRDTANLIVGNGWLRGWSNNNLNKDPGFTKGPFVTGSGLAHDSIDWTDPDNFFKTTHKDKVSKKNSKENSKKIRKKAAHKSLFPRLSCKKSKI